MHILLAFENSGDELLFDPTNHSVVEYYIDQLNVLGANSFAPSSPFAVQRAINQLQDTTKLINKFIHDLIGEYVPLYTEEEYLNQNILNELHCWWVQSQSLIFDIRKSQQNNDTRIATLANSLVHYFNDDDMLPDLGTVLSKLKHDTIYSKLNLDIHNVEDCITKYSRFSSSQWIEVPNVFDKSCITNDRYNLFLPFNHLGRSLYNKYLNFDSELQYDDENTFNQLLGFVDVKLQRVEHVPYSREYLGWCTKHNRAPIGDNLNIGSLPDLETKLYDYRLVLYRNTINKNKFSLHLA